MANEPDLAGGVATVSIRTWQKGLKRIDLDLTWQEGGESRAFNQHTYIHQAEAH